MADLELGLHHRRALKALPSIPSGNERPSGLSTVTVSKTNPIHVESLQASPKASEGKGPSATKNVCPTQFDFSTMKVLDSSAIREGLQKHQDYSNWYEISFIRYFQLSSGPRFHPGVEFLASYWPLNDIDNPAFGGNFTFEEIKAKKSPNTAPNEGHIHRNGCYNQKSAVSDKPEVYDDFTPRRPPSLLAMQSDAQSSVDRREAIYRPYSNPRRTSPKSKLLLVSLAAATPCAALTNIPRWSGSGPILAGVISGSSAITLPALPESDEYKALKTIVLILWAVAYLEFMRRAYLALRVPTARPMYLFCSLLLAAHFALGIAGAADSIAEAKSAILAFGPFLTTACAALVYIPFRYQAARASTAAITPERGERIGGARNTLEQHGADGDIGLQRSVMYAVLGITT